jgi:putative CocE/NonD family hydrolase
MSRVGVVSSRRSRALLCVAVVLALSATSAAALQRSGTGTAGGPAERASQAAPPEDPPGHAKRPAHAGGPGAGGDDVAEPPAAEPPMDYIAQAPRLSQPVYDQVVEEVLELPTHDGETIYVEVVRPDPEAYPGLEVPVVLEASPYHGTLADREGTRMFPDPVDEDGNLIGLTGYFAPRGYAVAMMDLRGTGRSTGCLDHLAGNDAQDLKMVVEHLAGADWSTGRVGMTGHSYVGSTPSVAAAMDPEGLVTIAPSAGLASMYDHQFHNGVPWNLQWVGPMIAYEGLAFERDLPPGTPAIPNVTSGNAGDNWEHRGGQPNPQTGCGLPNSAAVSGTGQVTGQYQDWHAQRDWADEAAAADIPVFMIHGVHDNAARIPASEWFFGGRFDREGDKVWIGQWDHGSTNGRCGDVEGAQTLHPTCRFDQFKYALHAWFDHHLQQRDVDTGPAVEAFLNAEQAVDITAVMDPETLDSKVLTSDAWREATSFLQLHPDATDMSLGAAPPESTGSASFTTGAEAVLASVGRGNVTFRSAPMATDTVLLGLSDLELHASVTNPLTHLVATLWRVDGAGTREPVDFCAIQPQLRDGIDTVSPVVPGEVMALDMQCFTVAQWVPAGQHLELEVSTGSQHHASFGDTNPQITVHTGPDLTAYRAPLVENAVLHDDVPLREAGDETDPVPVGPAQAPASGSVVVPAPGGGVIVEPVTAAAFEFDIEDGFDNARLEVVATPALPADLDIYLQRLDGETWSEDLAAGESGELDHETLVAGRQQPGRYRIVVHNWAGPPNEVEVVVTFLNGEGVPGTA